MEIIAKNLSKIFLGRKVLKDINIRVKRGEAVGLLGPNGAGKTTSFSIIAGLIRPDSGELYLDDQKITDYPIFERTKFGLGYLPQESSIFRGLNVEQNIMAILELVESDYETRNKDLEALLGEFGISHLRYANSNALSGGERRRLEIARTLATNPKFILLDEPLAGIDPIAVSDVKNLISKLKEKNIGILITDHNVRETLDIVDRAYIIYDGKVLFEGKPDEVLNSKLVKDVYLGDSYSKA